MKAGQECSFVWLRGWRRLSGVNSHHVWGFGCVSICCRMMMEAGELLE